jgi:hypothetical protein
MSDILKKKEAIEFLGLDEKTFENYFKNAGEFSCVERNGKKGRFMFDKQVLSKWREELAWRTVRLTKEDYALCLDFALAIHFKEYVLSDWGSGRQREFGQKITNWVKGQLGEVAVQKFLKREFGLEIKLDFDIHDKIVPQDIVGVVKGNKMQTPKIGVGIKSSKPKNAFLILGDNEIALDDRRSDVYIYCRPDIPDDHLLRITKNAIVKTVEGTPHYSSYKDLMPDFTDIPCEIAGWCDYKDLEKVTEIPGQKFDNGFRWVKKSGLLHRSKKEWENLIKRL